MTSMIDFESEPTEKVVRTIRIEPIPNAVEENQIITLIFEDDKAAREFIKSGGLPTNCRLMTLGVPAMMLLSEDQTSKLLNPIVWTQGYGPPGDMIAGVRAVKEMNQLRSKIKDVAVMMASTEAQWTEPAHWKTIQTWIKWLSDLGWREP